MELKEKQEDLEQELFNYENENIQLRFEKRKDKEIIKKHKEIIKKQAEKIQELKKKLEKGDTNSAESVSIFHKLCFICY